MLIDLHDAGTVPKKPYDVAIIGSGPAGISLALELAASDLRVVILETGRFKPSAEVDQLKETVSTGILIKNRSRERVLGGTSSSWAGLSVPLDPSNFDCCLGTTLPGWPIRYDDIRPYYQAASEWFSFPTLALFEGDGLESVRGKSDLAPDWGDLEERPYVARHIAMHFGREYRDAFDADCLDVILGAHALRLEVDRTGDATSVAIRTPSGSTSQVRATTFVLAAGGIENPRLLLRSTGGHPAGLGNEHDQVGRYLMNHPKNPVGIVELEEAVGDVPHLFGFLHKGLAGYLGLHVRADTRARLGILDSYVRFEPIYPWSDRRGVEAFLALATRSRFLLDHFAKRRHGQVVSMRDYAETGDDTDIKNERKSLLAWLRLSVAIGIDARWVAAYLYYRLLPGAVCSTNRIRLRNYMEMEPAAENRVTLSATIDPYGEPLAEVHHECTPLDRRSLATVHQTLGEELDRLGLGRLVGAVVDDVPWPIDDEGAHHIGTTRMGVDPATSVVDRNCRVHGSRNVYVAGSSVFSTSGAANPTYTIVALSIRLGAHLRNVLRPQSEKQPIGHVRLAERQAPSDEASIIDAKSDVEVPDVGRRRVLVVGAGRRVAADIVPALQHCDDRFEIVTIAATAERELTVSDRSYPVRRLTDLVSSDLDDINLVVVCVSKPAVPTVLGRLAVLGSRQFDVLIDTPVLRPRDLGQLGILDRFRNVWVAEDSATLPWIETVRAAVADGVVASPTEVHLDRAAYRYHGLSIMRSLLDEPLLRARRRRTDGGEMTKFVFAAGKRGTMLEPRDPTVGSCTIEAGNVRISDGPAGNNGVSGTADLLLRPIVEDNRCTGFRLDGVETVLSPAESDALGTVFPSDTITTRMSDFKRVGLMRMLEQIACGNGGYSVGDGLEDAFVDAALTTTGWWLGTPLTRLRSPANRQLLTRVPQLARLGRPVRS